MARPSKQTVEYFPHFVKSGKTLFILESIWGNTGYAFWFKMLESICESDGHTLRYSDPNTRDYFLARCGIQHADAIKIFGKLVELGNIDGELWNNREWVWCPSLIENLKVVYSKRVTPIPCRPEIVSGEKTGFPGRKQNAPPMREIVSGEKTPQSKVKERKGEGGGFSFNDNDNHNGIESDKDKSDAAAPRPESRPAPSSASPISSPSPEGSGAAGNNTDTTKKQFPEADIIAVAAAYCETKHMEFCNAIARSSYLRSKAVFYDAKDFLALNGGDVERACIAVKDFAREYEAAGKKDWNWKYLLQDWSKPEWGNGITWDELRRNYELEQQQEKAR